MSELSPVRKAWYMCAYSRTKTIKNILVTIKQFKNIINADNNFLRARADYIKGRLYLQKTKVKSSYCNNC